MALAPPPHAQVALHGGAANKNIGDAFLLVWKLPQLAHGGTHSRASSAGIKPRAFMPGAQPPGGRVGRSGQLPPCV